MTLHITEIERIRPTRRTDWRVIASAKLREQVNIALSQLDLVKEAQAARRKLAERQEVKRG